MLLLAASFRFAILQRGLIDVLPSPLKSKCGSDIPICCPNTESESCRKQVLLECRCDARRNILAMFNVARRKIIKKVGRNLLVAISITP